MPIIRQSKWYNSNKLAIAKYQEGKLYEPELDTNSDDDITTMLTMDTKYSLNTNIPKIINTSNGNIVILKQTDKNDNNTSDNINDDHNNTHNNNSDDNSNTNNRINISTLLNKESDAVWFSLPTEIEQNTYKRQNKKRYNAIVKNMTTYKLKKTKDGEDEAQDSPETVVNTVRMSKLDAEKVHKMSLMYLIMIKEGKLWLEFYNHISANVFYRRKDKMKSLVPENSRCLADCDNLLKIICRHIKYNILDEVFIRNHVNTYINRARKCFVKYYDDSRGYACRKLCFESVGRIGCILHKTNHPFIFLDLSNAYNNVTFSFLEKVLKEYLPDPSKIHPDAKNGDFNPFYDIRTDDELHNIVTSVSHLIRTIRYYDNKLDIEVRRNKGVPQGSALSVDLFIMCMDYIIKESIEKLKECLGLQYNKDYKVIAYVDDILILLKTEKAFKVSSNIIDVMSTVFNARHFKMNAKKSKCSPILAEKYGCDVTTVKPSDKYLGIYMEHDITKYMALVEKEIAGRYHNNPHMKSFAIIEKNILTMKTHEKARIRGKLQYVLIPFAPDKSTRGDVIEKLGYPNIASLFKDNNLDLSVINPKLDIDQHNGPFERKVIDV